MQRSRPLALAEQRPLWDPHEDPSCYRKSSEIAWSFSVERCGPCRTVGVLQRKSFLFKGLTGQLFSVERYTSSVERVSSCRRPRAKPLMCGGAPLSLLRGYRCTEWMLGGERLKRNTGSPCRSGMICVQRERE